MKTKPNTKINESIDNGENVNVSKIEIEMTETE
jgi:hypothetical protein